jgi:hypothetical protein
MEFMGDPLPVSLAALKCEGKDHLRTASASGTQPLWPGLALIGGVIVGDHREEYRPDFSHITLMASLMEPLIDL